MRVFSAVRDKNKHTSFLGDLVRQPRDALLDHSALKPASQWPAQSCLYEYHVHWVMFLHHQQTCWLATTQTDPSSASSIHLSFENISFLPPPGNHTAEVSFWTFFHVSSSCHNKRSQTRWLTRTGSSCLGFLRPKVQDKVLARLVPSRVRRETAPVLIWWVVLSLWLYNSPSSASCSQPS